MLALSKSTAGTGGATIGIITGPIVTMASILGRTIISNPTMVMLIMAIVTVPTVTAAPIGAIDARITGALEPIIIMAACAIIGAGKVLAAE